MIFLDSLLKYSGLSALVLLLAVILRGPLRSFKVLFGYCLTLLVSSWVEDWVQYAYGRGNVYRNVYWGFEILIDLFLFGLVSTLTYRVLGESPYKAKVGRILGFVAVAVIVLPLLIYSNRPMFRNAWFNGVSQFLNFGAALMTFGLWGAVVTSKTRDLQLLAVAAGLGLAVTGSAVSFGLRQFTSPEGMSRDFANIFGQLSFLVSILVWCWAIAKMPTATSSPPESAS